MTRTPTRLLTVVPLVLLLAACSAGAAPGDDPTAAPAGTAGGPLLEEFGVSAGHPLAAAAGAKMLRDGGTAVDAAIAAAFADAVVQPASSGIGGGGATIVVHDGEARNYDYREVVNQAGEIPPGGAGIAGFVAGMDRLHEAHGSLPWADLLAPAIDLAQQGAPVSRYLASTIDTPLGQRVTGELEHFHNADGRPLSEDETLVQAELAQTIVQLAEEGPDSFYTGDLAQRLIAEVEGYDAQSLAAYEVVESEPSRGPVGQYTVLSGAPALPGAAIIQLMQLAEAAGIRDVDPDSAQFVDLQSRAWTIANESVQTFFGDPAFVDVPVEDLTDPERNAELAQPIRDVEQTTQASAALPHYTGAANTTHISVVDATGMAVSMTNTITNYWGSGQYVAGFFMNDQLTRFSAIGTAGANVPAPGRRSVTWSSPTMVLDGQGRPVLAIGTPGGGQIPNTTASVVMRWALHSEDLEEAINADRFILTNGQLRLEGDRLAGQLEDAGYDVRVTDPSLRPNYGSVQAVAVDWNTGTLSSFADPRRSAGYVIQDATPN